jgi:hypothetical protein
MGIKPKEVLKEDRISSNSRIENSYVKQPLEAEKK